MCVCVLFHVHLKVPPGSQMPLVTTWFGAHMSPSPTSVSGVPLRGMSCIDTIVTSLKLFPISTPATALFMPFGSHSTSAKKTVTVRQMIKEKVKTQGLDLFILRFLNTGNTGGSPCAAEVVSGFSMAGPAVVDVDGTTELDK